MRTPKIGAIRVGRHSATSAPLQMGARDEDGGEYPAAHRREGRHGIGPATQPRQRMQRPDEPTGMPAGQHRKRRPAAPAGRREPDTSGVWYPTKTDWRSLLSGKTVNGHRLTRA